MNITINPQNLLVNRNESPIKIDYSDFSDENGDLWITTVLNYNRTHDPRDYSTIINDQHSIIFFNGTGNDTDRLFHLLNERPSWKIRTLIPDKITNVTGVELQELTNKFRSSGQIGDEVFLETGSFKAKYFNQNRSIVYIFPDGSTCLSGDCSLPLYEESFANFSKGRFLYYENNHFYRINKISFA